MPLDPRLSQILQKSARTNKEQWHEIPKNAESRGIESVDAHDFP